MKAILEFDLPEDDKDHLMAANALNAYLALWDISQYLRSQERHDGTDNIEQIRNRFHSILEAHGVDLDLVV